MSRKLILVILVAIMVGVLTYFLMGFWYTILFGPCDKLKVEKEKTECKKIVTVCEGETSLAKDICYQSLAQTTGIIEFCERTRYPTSCKESVARSINKSK